MLKKKQIFIILIFLILSLLISITIISSTNQNYTSNSPSGINTYACTSSSCSPLPSASPPTEKPYALAKQSIITGGVFANFDDASVWTITASRGYTYLILNLTDISLSNASKFINSINYSVGGYFSVGGGIGAQAYYYNYNSQTWNTCGNVLNEDVNSNSQTSCVINNLQTINYTNQLTYLLFQSKQTSGVFYADYINININYSDILVNSLSDNQEILNNLSTTLNISSVLNYNNTIWYSWNNGITNNTLCTELNECQGTITFPRQNYYNLTVYGNKSDGTIINDSVSNLFVGDTISYNYEDNNGTILFVYEGDGITDPSPPTNSFHPSIDIDITGNSTFNSSDDVRRTVSFAYNEEGYHLFVYSLPTTMNYRSINWTWEGQNTLSALRISFYFWNSPSLSWINCASDYAGTVDSNINCSGSADYLINSSNNGAFIAYSDNVGQGVGTGMRTDFAEISVTYFSQNTAPSITHILPNNTNFSIISKIGLSSNITDDNDYVSNISLYLNSIINQTNINVISGILTNFTFTGITDGTYTYFISSTDSDNTQINSTTQSFTIDTTAPLITITSPLEFQEFSVNTSIVLNATIIETGVGLQSCNLALNGGTNNSITCGNNATFDAPDGINYITYCSQDRFGFIGCDTNQITISLDAPSINLDSPTNNTFFNGQNNIYLNYTTIDANGIDTVQIWHNLNGSFSLNQTNVGVTSTQQNFTIVNTSSDGIYKWNVWSNDTTNSGRFSTNNFTFIVDTINPLSNITNIATTNGFQTVKFNHTASDTNLQSCKYTVYNSSSGIDNNLNNVSITCNNLNTQFVVTEYGNYILNLTVNDSAGNINQTTKSFTVSPNIVSSPITSGGGGDSPSKVPAVAIVTPSLENIINTLTLTSDLTDLQRAILYRIINDFCGEKSKQPLSIVDNSQDCFLTNAELSTLTSLAVKEGIPFSEKEMTSWFLQYKNNNIENIQVSESELKQFNLIQSIIGLLNPLRFNKPSIDSPQLLFQSSGSRVISTTLTANKGLKSCGVISDTPELSCELITNETVKISYNLSDTSFFNKNFQGKISILTDAPSDKQESASIQVIFRVYNLGYEIFEVIPVWIILISVSTLVLFLSYLKIIGKFSVKKLVKNIR